MPRVGVQAVNELTTERLAEWKEDPAAVPDEEHDAICDSGFVYLPDGAAAICPVCAWRKERDRLLKEMEQAGISRRYLQTEWSDLEIRSPFPAIKKAGDSIKQVLRSGTSAIFTGPPGTGKSTAAALLARAAIERGHSAHMGNIGRVSALVRARYDGEEGWSEAQAIRWLSSPDLLVLDDLGAGETREGTHEVKILYLALEERQANDRITVVTTNLPEDHLRDRLGERVMNRLMPYKVFRFGGKNYRRQKAAGWPV